MVVVGLIMNDDIEGVEVWLCMWEDFLIFYVFGMGVLMFMRSIFSFEKDIMNEVVIRLNVMEVRVWDDKIKVEKEVVKVNGMVLVGYWYLFVVKFIGLVEGGMSNIYFFGLEFVFVYVEV